MKYEWVEKRYTLFSSSDKKKQQQKKLKQQRKANGKSFKREPIVIKVISFSEVTVTMTVGGRFDTWTNRAHTTQCKKLQLTSVSAAAAAFLKREKK